MATEQKCAIMRFMQTTIEKIIYPGKSLARHEGKVILTDEGLPGETVEVTVVEENKDYIEAVTSKILTPSAHRVEPRCGHYRVCSKYQTISYDFQIKIKEEQLKEIFSRSLQAMPPIIFRPSDNIWHYRNKIDFHIIRENGAPKNGDAGAPNAVEAAMPHLAYHLPGVQEKFVTIDSCFLASPQVNNLAEAALKIITENKLTPIKKITIKESSAGKLLLAVYGDSGEVALEPFLPLTKQFPLNGLAGIDIKHPLRKNVLGEDFIEERIGETVFHIGPQSFFQINIVMLQKLLQDLKTSLPLSGNELVADLYCGVGTFGIALAPYVEKVLGVEEGRENVYFLKKNIRLNNVGNFRIYKETCEEWISRLPKVNLDAMIIDPPRKGLGQKFCRDLLAKPPRFIAYISCNPSTLARDLKILSSNYTVKNIFAYDFFPQTPHIETLAVLERKI